MNVKLLIADDDAGLWSTFVEAHLGEGGGVAMECATDPATCLKMLKDGDFDAVLLDDDFGPGERSGTEIIPEIRRLSPRTGIVMFTNVPKGKNGMALALAAGADDFATKGNNGVPEVISRVKEVLAFTGKELSRRTTGRQLADRFNIAYRSKAVEEAFSTVALYRERQINALIEGRTGTGKEALAQAFARERRPFKTLNCAGIAQSLLESELFGHDKGGFTGAIKPRRGLLEEADGGDLFLDEAHLLPMAMQSALLRVIESGEVKRVGSNQTRIVTVRYIAAVSVDLATAVADGEFLEALYGRLTGVKIVLPPLCDRREDILPIFDRHLALMGHKDITVVPEVRDYLETLPWPRNARQIRDLVHALVPIISGKVLTPVHLQKSLAALQRGGTEESTSRGDTRSKPGGGVAESLTDTIGEVTARRVEQVVKDLGPRVSQRKVALALGISLSRLQRALKRYNITIESS